MAEKLRTVRLYGVLGSKFGRKYQLAVSNAREAAHALSVLLPGFEAYMMNAHTKGMGFSVFVGKTNLAQDELEYPVGDDDIRIAPIMMGAKKGGMMNIIAGAVLIVAGIAVTYMTFGGASAVGWAMIEAGIGIMAGGIVQMLTPVPKGLGAKDHTDNTASYNFNGPVNTQAQGNPVPLLYGRLIVGSAVISAGIRSDDVYIPVPNTGYGGGSVKDILNDFNKFDRENQAQ